MGIKNVGIAVVLFFVSFLLLPQTGSAGEKIAKPWVTGYLPGDWQEGNGNIGILTEDEWDVLTHVVHFAAGINSDGSLNFDFGSPNKVGASKRAGAISQAHSHDVLILFSVNAWIDHYQTILSDDNKRETLVNALISVLKEGYDGLDLDLEPIRSGTGFIEFITELQTAMKGVNKSNNPNMKVERPLLAVSILPDDAVAGLLKPVQDKIDQMNLMTYDMSTIWQCETWHDSALYDGGNTYRTTGGKVVSVDNVVKKFISAGIPAHKLGLGMSLEVRIWQGGSFSGSSDGALEPLQLWATSRCDTSPNRPLNWNDGTTPRDSYADLMKNRYQPDYYKWDDEAKMPYLSINKSGSDNDMFISYNDARSVHEKVKYAKDNQLGGVMIWHLASECYNSSNLDQCVAGRTGDDRPIMGAIRKTLRTGAGK